MTIDEWIEYIHELRRRNNACGFKRDAEKFKQLAEWLEDYKILLKKQEAIKPSYPDVCDRMYCMKCGAAVTAKHIYCWKCGQKLKEVSK